MAWLISNGYWKKHDDIIVIIIVMTLTYYLSSNGYCYWLTIIDDDKYWYCLLCVLSIDIIVVLYVLVLRGIRQCYCVLLWCRSNVCGEVMTCVIGGVWYWYCIGIIIIWLKYYYWYYYYCGVCGWVNIGVVLKHYYYCIIIDDDN